MALWSTCAVVQKPLPEKMLKLDHLTIVAPSLERGAAHVRQQLGVEMQRGGKHPEMGTHNCLLRLGEGTFLEVIAPDPEAPPPTRARWFGLDDVDGIERAWARGDCLTAWVAQTRDLTGLLERHGRVLGRSIRVSRGDRCWHISIPDDGALPCGGSAPSAIDWGDRGSPATEMTSATNIQPFTLMSSRKEYSFFLKSICSGTLILFMKTSVKHACLMSSMLYIHFEQKARPDCSGLANWFLQLR